MLGNFIGCIAIIIAAACYLPIASHIIVANIAVAAESALVALHFSDNSWRVN